jgi:GT2 family glycosyltransferase
MSDNASPRLAKLAVVIVGYRNPDDIAHCLHSLAGSTWEDFAIFVCENGGAAAFAQLTHRLFRPGGGLERVQRGDAESLDWPGGRIARVARGRLRGKRIAVRLGLGVDNLGYGGGVNAWLERLLDREGWEAALVLNPDTEMSQNGLRELWEKAQQGYDMVGPTLVFSSAPDRLINCGLRWSVNTGRVTAVGRNLPSDRAPPGELLASVEAVSGACVLATRAHIEQVGLMTEDYFLYMEDLDWGRRGERARIGFADKAVVRHVGGTTIGSSVDPNRQSPLSVYLSARNSILYARRHAGIRWLLHLGTQIAYAARFALIGATASARLTLRGLVDGVRGKSGRPDPSLWA